MGLLGSEPQSGLAHREVECFSLLSKLLSLLFILKYHLLSKVSGEEIMGVLM